MILEIECLFLYCESKETAVSEHTKFIFCYVFAMFDECWKYYRQVLKNSVKLNRLGKEKYFLLFNFSYKGVDRYA